MVLFVRFVLFLFNNCGFYSVYNILCSCYGFGGLENESTLKQSREKCITLHTDGYNHKFESREKTHLDSGQLMSADE